MARIPDEELQRIKSQVKVEDLCREYGIELKRMGPDNLMGRCPFHDDHTPSFGVTPSKNLWNCLAGCGGGDTIQLVMKKEKVSFRQAAEILRQRLGVAPSAPVVKTRMGTTHAALVADTTDLADHVLMRHVSDFYHQTFCNDIKAMRYLQERCCFNAEATKAFQIGYANRTLGYRVPPARTTAGNALKPQLQRLGILRASGHEHMTGCVVFPILDEHGNVAQMYGRKITPNLRDGTPLHLYLPGEHRAVWNAAGLRSGGGQKEILLCESIIDALTLWCAGFRNVMCAYGVNGFTEAHWALIEELKPRRIVNCFDNDDAGNTSAAKLAEKFIARGIIVARAKLPPGKDINDVACMNKDAQVALAIALETPAEAAGMDGPIIITSAPASDETSRSEPAQGELAEPIGAGKEKVAPFPEVPAASALAADSPSLAPAAKEKMQSAPTAPARTAAAEAPTETPAQAAKDPPAGDEAFFTFGPRQWRVRGIGKNLAFESLRVQLRVLVQSGEQYSFHLDSLDLCNAKHRQNFIALAHAETHLDENLLKRDLGQVYLKVEGLQEKCIREATEPRQKEVIVPDVQSAAAMELLKDPKLLDRILADFDRCGVVGEQINKLVGYLATISRKLDEPLHRAVGR